MKNRKRAKISEQEALRLLDYEVWMLNSMAKGLSSGIAGDKSPIKNALLESFLIHARILIDFLYKENAREDDIVAEDFFSPPDKWRQIRGGKSNPLKDAEKPINKCLAHLTSVRLVEFADYSWSYDEIAGEINKVLEIFFNHIQKDSRAG